MKFALMVFALVLSLRSCSQSTGKLDFETYDPVSTLVVPEHKLTKAKFPFIDVHNHQWGDAMSPGNLRKLTADMDKLNMQVMVNLSGGNGSELKKMADDVKGNYPKRFIIFANIDFDGVGSGEWTSNAVKQLESDVRNGANGLKIFKDLGFNVKDINGKRVPVDDPRLDPIWDKCGNLKYQ